MVVSEDHSHELKAGVAGLTMSTKQGDVRITTYTEVEGFHSLLREKSLLDIVT